MCPAPVWRGDTPRRRCALPARPIAAHSGASDCGFQVQRRSGPKAIAANAAIGLVAVLHACFLVLEMFLWDKPTGCRAFGMTREMAAATNTLAANQGLYNGFLCVGLLWGLYLGTGPAATQFKVFFLLCVVVAGICEAATVHQKILFVQALPAVIALALLYLA